MLVVIAYGCERMIEDGVRLVESDALCLAMRGRFLFIPSAWFGHRRDCFLWTMVNILDRDARVNDHKNWVSGASGDACERYAESGSCPLLVRRVER